MLSGFPCQRQSKHTDAQPGYVTKGIGAGNNRSPCCQHIIHQQEVLSPQSVGRNTGKQISHVFPSCILSFMRLCIIIPVPYHNFSIHRNTCHHRNSPCQTLTLIIPPQTFFTLMQRDRDNQIYPIEKWERISSDAIARPITSPTS